MKKLISPLILAFFLLIVQTTKSQRFTLVEAGASKSSIIIPECATDIEIQAAKIFQDYIQRISGARIPIESDKIEPRDGEILIGNVNRLELKDVPLEELGEDGLFIKNNSKSLIISGGHRKGVLYGVYTFLEKYMGCRKYSSKVTYVPKQKTIILESIRDKETPAFKYRENNYKDAYDPEYMDWHKLHSRTQSDWGTFGHTFDALLSSKEYGETHPEYFSFYDGKRHPGYNSRGYPLAQLCLTNPDVLEIVSKNLKSQIEHNPEKIYWSVKQNDNINYCRCPECTELNEKYASFTPGSKIYNINSNTFFSPIGQGSLLTFVNKVAERFPDKKISTFAYLYSRVPPKNLIPRKNVNIMICNLESPRNASIENGDTSFSKDLIGWTHLTNDIIIWDYVVQFSNLMSPFPNLRILQPNLQYFHDNGVSMIYEQGNRSTGGEFSELRAYLISKLLWNPNLDINEVMDDFLSGFYGNASGVIREYIDLLHDEMEQSGIELSIYGNPMQERKTFLSDSLVTVYNQIFDRAEKAVSESTELLQRVKTARLPVYYAMLEIAMDQKTGENGSFVFTDDNTLKPNPKIIEILNIFVDGCIRANVQHLKEGGMTPQEYLTSYTKFIEWNLDDYSQRKPSLVKGELANTIWKGQFNIPNSRMMFLKFKTDTVELKYPDNTPIETMKYKISNDTLTIRKLSGATSCSYTEDATYKIMIKDKKLVLTLLNDDCHDRRTVWPTDDDGMMVW